MAKKTKNLVGSDRGSIAKGTKKVSPVDKIVGENVRRLRIASGMSQEQLGIQCGITFQQIQKYEKGTNRISASRMDEFAVLFNVDHNAFFAGVSEARDTSSNVADRVSLSQKAFRLGRMFDGIEDKRIQQKLFALVSSISGQSDGADDAEADTSDAEEAVSAA